MSGKYTKGMAELIDFSKLTHILNNNWRRIIKGISIIIFITVGTCLTRTSVGEVSITWMHIYDLKDFNSISSIVRFLGDLRVPIPPIIAILEILDYLYTGNAAIVTVVSYRVALIAVYAIAILLSGSSIWRMAASFMLSVIFLWTTTIVHKGNAQTYDIFYPLFILLYVLLLQLCLGASSRNLSVGLITTSGFFLSMAELTRPFFFMIIPLVLICTYFIVRQKGKSYFLWFLVPILLFSGTWHAYIFIEHGQVTWTNHSGFNLYNAWNDVAGITKPLLVKEINANPLAPGRWKNLNTSEHTINSNRLEMAVLEFILHHPKVSFGHILKLFVNVIIKVPTSIYAYKPQDRILEIYKPLATICFIISIWNLAIAIYRIFMYKEKKLLLLNSIEFILIYIGLATLFIFIISERGEEARFLLSVLPFWASAPLPRLSWFRDSSN